MTRSRFGVLSICTVILGLMAFAAGSAQAEVGSNWMINGANLANNTLKPTVVVKELENKTGSLLSTILGIPVKVLCTSASIESGAALLLEGKISEGTLDYSGCKTYLNGSAVESTPCLPKTAGVPDLIKTKLAKGLILLLLSSPGVVETLVDIEPAVGEELAVIESTEECAVGQKIVIRGRVDLKDCEKMWGLDQVTHLVVESPPPASSLTANKQPATLDGSMILALGGVHAGSTWSALGSTKIP